MAVRCGSRTRSGPNAYAVVSHPLSTVVCMEEQQTHLPLDGTAVPQPEDADDTPIQFTLPFDLDEPIPFALTARARRAVSPESLPELTLHHTADLPTLPLSTEDGVVARVDTVAPDTGGEDEQWALADLVPSDLDAPNDTRPARARALRHAGIDADQIADELDVDELVVHAWVDGIAPVRSARRRLRAVADGPAPVRERQARVAERRRHAEEAFAAARTEARDAARDRVHTDPDFVRGLGLFTGIATFSAHAVVLTTRDESVAKACLSWLTATVDVDPTRVRVILRLAPQVAADLAVQRWRDATDVSDARIGHTRWREAPDASSVEAMIRVADPRCAGLLAGWRDALLGSFDEVDDREF